MLNHKYKIDKRLGFLAIQVCTARWRYSTPFDTASPETEINVRIILELRYFFSYKLKRSNHDFTMT